MRCLPRVNLLCQVGVSSLNELTAKTVPAKILLDRPLDLGAYSAGLSESDALEELKRIASANKAAAPLIVPCSRIACATLAAPFAQARAASAKQPQPSSRPLLAANYLRSWQVFKSFMAGQAEMDGKTFIKVFKDCKLLNKSV